MSTEGALVAVVRADGSLNLGQGHIFRTLVLAEELQRRGWRIVYVSNQLPTAMAARILDAGHGLHTLPPDLPEHADADETARIAEENGAAWVVVDRYATGEQSLRAWSQRGLRTLAIDDVCRHPFPVDILLNQNTDATGLQYSTRSDTRRLLGPRFALVNRAYADARRGQAGRPRRVERVMVFMGGGDPNDETARVLRALKAVERRLDIDVIVGAAYPHFDRLASSSFGLHSVRPTRDLPNLVEPMLRADVAIVAGGSVTWELACLGVPMLIVTVADNQDGVARSMHAAGAALHLGAARALGDNDLTDSIGRALGDPEALAELAVRCSELVDGRGASRVADALCVGDRGRMPARELRVRVRPAGVADMKLLWDWANEPGVRANSFTSAPIPWEDHQVWFGRKLASADTLLLVGLEPNDRPVGQIRFEIDGSEAVLHYSLDKSARGRGLGADLVIAGIRALADARTVEVVHAETKPENVASIKALERGGFVRVSPPDGEDDERVQLVWHRKDQQST